MRLRIAPALAALVCLPAVARGAGIVGNGSPGSCTEAALNQALLGFGTVTFNCGGGPVVIPITSSKTLTATTTIDGTGQQITLDGGNATRLFETTYQFSSFTLTFRNLTMRNARSGSGFGGAMRFNYQDFPTTVNIENVTFTNNVAAQAGPDVGGGAFHAVTGFVNVHNSTFSGNRGGNGGAIGQIGAVLTIEDSTFTGNSTHAQVGGNGGAGGAIYIDGSSNSVVAIRRTAFVSNSSTGLGGAIHTYQYAGASGVAIEYCYFGGNTTVRNGGAIYHQNGTLAITGSTFEGNITQGQGGALWLLEASTTTITNSTFVGNDAVGIPPNNGSSGLGGAILINASSNVTISHSTIANNHADWVGGGICGGMGGGSVTTLRATIVANNSADNGGNPWNIAHNCASQLLDGGFNLQFPTHANPGDPNDPNCTAGIGIANPLLGALGANGGPTPTMPLLPGSPARDAVASGCPPPATDQRGMARPLGSACDIGAFEADVNADLSIAKSDSIDPVFTGAPLAYMLSVSNAGPAAAGGVTVVDPLPTGVSFVSASPGCSNSSGTVTCNLGTLAAGASTNLTINVSVVQATGQLTNTASVTSANPDPAAANNSDTETTQVSPADLSLAIDDSADPVTPGSPFSYVLDVTNNGPAAATGVTITNTLSPAVTFVSASAGCTNASGTVTCAVGGLAVAATASRTINVTANNWGGAVDTASVGGTQTDPAAANNTATEVTLFDLGLSKELVHGSDERLTLEALPGPLAREELFRIRRPPRTSWEIVVDGTSGDVSGASGALDLQLLGSDLATVVGNSVGIGAGHSRSLRLVNPLERDVVEQLIRVRSTGCTTGCGPEDVYRIRAWETTYRASRFNNSGSQITVVFVENGGNASVAGTLWLWRGDGTLAASQPFNVPARGIFVLNTSGIAPSTSGSITVTHDGPYGALSGKAVAIEPATGFTFDTPLVPRPR
jgi:uncharacterized repeat protein (TIGR01451 family)